MRGLSARQALEAWERGEQLRPVDRPIALLAAAFPDLAVGQLRDLPLGGRDALLFRLREETFGRSVKGFALCPECGARLEFELDTRGFPIDQLLGMTPEPQQLEAEGLRVAFRLPASTDFVAMGRCRDPQQARALLIDRCVLAAEDEEGPVLAAALPETVVAELARRMEDLDPMADLPLAIECARCTFSWTVVLDIAAILWREIADLAVRLLDEVQQLARGYGWSEREILEMSTARRRFYLKRLSPESELV